MASSTVASAAFLTSSTGLIGSATTGFAGASSFLAAGAVSTAGVAFSIGFASSVAFASSDAPLVVICCCSALSLSVLAVSVAGLAASSVVYIDKEKLINKIY